MIAGVDPGLRSCGLCVAETRTGAIEQACLVKNPETEDDGALAWISMALQVQKKLFEWSPQPFDLLVIERQFIAPVARNKTRNPNQLIGLTAVMGAILALVDAQKKIAIYPSSWKGATKADEKCEEILATLTEADRKRCPDVLKSTGHNVLDAIGIARWGLVRSWYGLRLGEL